MGFLIVNRNTGEVIGDKIYTFRGRAEAVIEKKFVSDKNEWVIIPMPSADLLKAVAAGSHFSCVKYMGNLSTPELDFE